MSNPVCCASHGFFDVNSEYFLEKNERNCENEGNREELRESSPSSDIFVSEVTEHNSSSGSEDSSSIAVRIRPFQKNEVSRLDTRNLDKKKSSLTGTVIEYSWKLEVGTLFFFFYYYLYCMFF